MKDWVLILVTALNDGSITTEHVATFAYKPRCEYSAKARKLYFPALFNKEFICLQKPIQAKHK